MKFSIAVSLLLPLAAEAALVSLFISFPEGASRAELRRISFVKE